MKDCSSKKPCYYCKEAKKHASALCPKKFGYQQRKLEKPSTANTDKNTTSAVQKSRYKTDQEYFSAYNKILEQQLTSGVVIEEIPFNRTENEYYLPHRGITREHKSTALQIVYNGSAKPGKNKHSLNECIYKGKTLLSDLLELLLRLRRNHIAFTSDTGKAFLQISINTEDRDYV